MFGTLFTQAFSTYTLPVIVHNVSPINSPLPYFRLHIIRSNPSVKRSLLDILNSKPYRFGFTKDQLKHLLQKDLVQVWVSSVRVKITIPPHDNDFFDRIMKAPLSPYSVITYNQHIHETPVPTPERLKILSSTNSSLLAINKPPGIPVHGVQKYFYNTIQSMLAEQLACKQVTLYPLHRLDRLTSGVLLWATNPTTVSKFKNRNAWCRKKIYLARVKGRLPNFSTTCTDDLVYLYPTRHMVRVFQGSITSFKEVCYDQKRDESVICAFLNTGFPHQIRIHLRNLGCPIIDDPLYSKTGKYKEITRSRNDVTDAYWEEVIQRSKEIQSKKRSVDSASCSICNAPKYHVPKTNEHGDYAICLHAWRYEYKGVPGGPYAGERHSYETPIPSWAIPIGTNEEFVKGIIVYHTTSV